MILTGRNSIELAVDEENNPPGKGDSTVARQLITEGVRGEFVKWLTAQDKQLESDGAHEELSSYVGSLISLLSY